MTILATDDFNRANGGLGANWTTGTGVQPPRIVSNEALGNAAANVCDANYTGALVGGGAWPNDQYSQFTIGSVVDTTSDEGVGPACRMASGAQTQYFAQTNTVETKLYKVVAGTFTQLGVDGAACATGNVLRLECVGDQITVKKNGTTIIGPITDSAIASGNAGMWCTHAVGAIDSFEGGDFAAGATTLPELVMAPLRR